MKSINERLLERKARLASQWKRGTDGTNEEFAAHWAGVEPDHLAEIHEEMATEAESEAKRLRASGGVFDYPSMKASN